MTATGLLERLAASASTKMMALTTNQADNDRDHVDVSVAAHRKPAPPEDAGAVRPKLDRLPTVTLELLYSFLTHAELHAVEMSSSVLADAVNGHWKNHALESVVVADHDKRTHAWKDVACIAHGFCREEDKRMLKGVIGFSSADRDSENPNNTLAPSQCWREICKFDGRCALDRPHEFLDIPSFAMTLGERIQMKCGCSRGRSCYWSSSASTDKFANDYIDYALDGPTLVSAVQVLPYRVFWHPGSPTYAPIKVRFEFREKHTTDDMNNNCDRLVYESPEFPVQNDMTLQTFRLPRKVWASDETVLRVHLLGRQQQQTFELPAWMQQNEEDQLPKYYSCLSYVNAVGVSKASLSAPRHVEPQLSKGAAPMPASSSPSLGPTALAEFMVACVEGLIDISRRRSDGVNPS
ncbi:hypothetical protein PINS_up004993 [Pythium insidiosum]|nr:hypothetical protein PINS_up004993 [Pythium insidiosum]